MELAQSQVATAVPIRHRLKAASENVASFGGPTSRRWGHMASLWSDRDRTNTFTNNCNGVEQLFHCFN